MPELLLDAARPALRDMRPRCALLPPPPPRPAHHDAGEEASFMEHMARGDRACRAAQ